jgi:hypothetical protein
MKTLLLIAGSIALSVGGSCAEAAVQASVVAAAGDLVMTPGSSIQFTAGEEVVGQAASEGLTACAGYWFVPCGSAPASDVDLEEPLAASFRFYPIRPNPIGPRNTLSFDVPAGGGHVRLGIFDVTGRRVVSLIDGHVAAGHHQSVWDGYDSGGRLLASGIYIVLFEGDGYRRTQRMTLLR